MKHLSNTEAVFFELIKAGLWEKEVCLGQYDNIDFAGVFKLTEEQSVVGLITAGLEQVKDVKIPQVWSLQFIGATLQIEQCNKEMNQFIGVLMRRLKQEEIYAVVVKGQGVAQCYERPLWRASGDIDLFLDRDNYERAKTFLRQYSVTVEEEDRERLHLGMNVDSWIVELHGTLRTKLSKRISDGIDRVQEDVFEDGGVRVWRNDETDVHLPNAADDVILIFTHFINQRRLLSPPIYIGCSLKITGDR